MQTHFLAILILAVGYALTGCSRVNGLKERPAAGVGRAADGRQQQNPGGPMIVYDDLEWLVGKWSCVHKEIYQEQQSPPNYLGPDSLTVINVFYPFFYDEMTLALKRVPERQIVAEFLVRRPDGKFLPMDAGTSAVMIGIDKLVIGTPAPHSVEFTYKRKFDDKEAVELLELHSVDARPQVHLVFRKVADFAGQAETLWNIDQNAQQKLLRQCQHDYQELKYERLNPK